MATKNNETYILGVQEQNDEALRNWWKSHDLNGHISYVGDEYEFARALYIQIEENRRATLYTAAHPHCNEYELHHICLQIREQIRSEMPMHQ